MAIRLDISPTSVVVYCTDCGHWRAFAWTPDEGRASAARHEENVHPESRKVRDQIERTAKVRARRHAADSNDARKYPEYSTHGNSRPARTRKAHE